VRWYGPYFILESVNPPATTQVDALTDVLAADSEAEQKQARARRHYARDDLRILALYGYT
jgi:hypothetical protein